MNIVVEGSGRKFWRIALVVFAVIAAVNYLPVLRGRVPFPQDLVLRHAAWDQSTGAAAPKPTPAITDLITSFYPYRALIARASSLGLLPLWNPYILGGTPLEASSQSAPFYPFNFLYYVFPLNLAWSLCIIVRLFLAALFMAALVRAIGGTITGSIFSGIIFSLSGFMTAWQGQGMGDAAIWLPMICYSVHRLHTRPSTASIALASVSFAMPVLSGHPETAVHLAVTGCIFALLFVRDRQKQQVEVRFIAHMAFAGILALGLASVQIVPTLEWFGQLGKFVDRIPPALSRHDGQGLFSRDLMSSPSSALVPIPEAASYLGMIGLMAVPLALFHRSKQYVLFFALIAAGAAAIAFSVEPMHWIASHLPLFKSMKNGRLILVATFGIAALAGLGISAIEQNQKKVSSEKRKLALILIAGAFLLCIGGIYEVHRATFVPVEFLRGPWGPLQFLLAGAGLLVWRVKGKVQDRLFSILLCGIAAVELLSFSFGYTGFAETENVFPTAPVYEFLKSRGDPSTFRIAKSGYPIPANSGILYGLESADGYEIPTERAKTFNSGLTEERDDAVFYDAGRVAQSRDRRMDMLNVKYWIVIARSPQFREFSQNPERFKQIYTEGSIAIFENMSVLPRLFASPQAGIQIIPDANTQMAQIRDPLFVPEKTVYFSAEPLRTRSDESGILSFKSDIQLIQSGMNTYAFQTRTSSPSVLVLSQIYYPGWKAAIDGTVVPVYPVDYALTGILAPQGEHTVRFYFQPDSFRTGVLLSLISLMTTIGLLIVGSVWKKTEGPSSASRDEFSKVRDL
jgi:hypothetical protein